MNLVFGTLELTTIAGGHTYLVTVAEQLERMGHGVTVFTEDAGEMAAVAEKRGLRVVTDAGELPESCDVVYAQDTPSAYSLAERYRETPQVFAVHHDEHGRWVVPQVPGIASAVVACSELHAQYARSLAHAPEVVRLRFPVDTRRFSPRAPIADSPRRALVMGNYLAGKRLEMVRDACSEMGIELVERGLQAGEVTTTPEVEINDSDIVIGRSQVIVEAMSCGRAAYVFDVNGSDGWVTPQTHELLEAAHFDGAADPQPVDPDRLRAELGDYSAEMGAANRDLALTHHSAKAHCQALVDLFGRLAPRSEPAATPLDELARLTRIQWQTDAQALGFEHEAKLLRAELERRNAETVELQEQTRLAQERAARAEREAAEARERVARLEAGRFGAFRRLGRANR
jgi:hypothetical protein